MKNNLLKLSAIAILLSTASCSTQTHDKLSDNRSRIVENEAEDNLIIASKEAGRTSEITESVPSVSQKISEKIIITKETLEKAKEEQLPVIQVAREESLKQAPEIKPEEKNEEIQLASVAPEARGSLETSVTPTMPVEDDVITTSAENAAVGECYGKVKVAARYKDINEDVVVQPERTVTNVIPAKYETKSEEVVVKEETYKYVEIPATYKTVTEEITVEPEKKEIVTIPAVYKTITEKVMVQPAQKVWKKGRGLIEKVGSEGDIMCLVEEPAVYKDVEKQVLVTPERTETRVIPAVKKLISKQVVDEPVKVQKIAVPAVKEIVQKRILVEPEKTVTKTLPAVYQQVKKRVQVSPDKVEMLPVICNSNVTRDLVIKLQTALVNRGYDIGKIDGFFGEKTSSAINNFQKSLGLQSGGITYQTAKALGVEI